MNYESELQDLRIWLNNPARKFDDGIQLYMAYINDVDVRRSLTLSRSETRLYELLRSRAITIKEQLTAPAPASTEVVKQKDVITEKGAVTRAINIQIDGRQHTEKAKLIEHLEKEWKQLRAEQGAWHTKMASIGLDDKERPREILTGAEIEKRRIWAVKILAHEKEIVSIWNKIDYVSINGVLPVPYKEEKVELESDFKRLTNVRSNISKLKKKIKIKKLLMEGLKGKDWDDANEWLTGWEKDLAELEAEKETLSNGNK